MQVDATEPAQPPGMTMTATPSTAGGGGGATVTEEDGWDGPLAGDGEEDAPKAGVGSASRGTKSRQQQQWRKKLISKGAEREARASPDSRHGGTR